MKIMKKIICGCLFFISLIGFGQNISNHKLTDKQRQEMVIEFIKATTEYEKQIDNNYQTFKKGSNSKDDIDKLRTINIYLKKNMDYKINGIELKYNIQKKDLYLYISEYYKNEN